MSFSDVHPGDPMNASNVQQVIDALKGTAGKGVPLSPTAVNNSTNYALSVENLDATNSRAINVLKSDGSVLIRADVNGVTLGSPITAPAASLPGSVLTNASVTNAQLGPDVARANLLTNGGFELWQRGNGPFSAAGGYAADRWLLLPGTGGTVTVTKEASVVDASSPTSLKAVTTYGSAFCYVGQKIEDFAQLSGRTLSASVRVWCSAASAVRLNLQTNTTNANYSTYHPGGSTWQTLSVTMTAPTLTALYLYAQVEASCTLYLDNAMLVVGSVPVNYVPLHPADDLARCLRYYEALGVDADGALIVSGVASAGGQSMRASMYFKAIKPVAPSVTKTGTWATGNAQQPVVGNLGWKGMMVYTNSSAAGDAYTMNTGAGSNYVVEANP